MDILLLIFFHCLKSWSYHYVFLSGDKWSEEIGETAETNGEMVIERPIDAQIDWESNGKLIIIGKSKNDTFLLVFTKI